MLLLPPKTLLALCVLAILSARSASASSPFSSSSLLDKRSPLASDASSHSSRPSKYFPAPYTPGQASSSSPNSSPAASDDTASASDRAKKVAFRSARISAATEDRIRRKRAAVAAAKRAAAAEPRAAPAVPAGPGSAHVRRAVTAAAKAPVSAQELARRAQVKADSAWVAAHLSQRGLGGPGSGSAARGVDERFERKVRGAAGGKARGH
ncbi:hypothetical protein JCM9279_006057 [Rhodotorula babjevae]